MQIRAQATTQRRKAAKTQSCFLRLAPLLLGALALFTGCSFVGGSRSPDGSLRVHTLRLFWKSEAVGFTIHDSRFTNHVSIGKSASDADAISQVTEAAVRGAVKGASGR